jgi:hypothetical protein
LARAVFMVLVVAQLCSCSGVFFQPMRPWVRTPADIGLRYEDVRIQAADGSTLSAWFLPADQPKANATLLFLHGNGENISTHIAAVRWLPPQGFNVLLLDYRGYGASDGRPSVAGAQQDIDSAMRYVLARGDVDNRRIIVLGQSLGGALGLHYVAHSAYREHIRGVVIDSAFVGYRDIAREKLQKSWLTWLFAVPLSLTVTDDFRPIDAAPKIAPIPLLLIHGDRDIVVPVHHSKWLYDAAQQPKEVWVVPEVGHIQSLAQTEIRERLIAWLQVQLAK